jgi:hypothetical protein
MNRVTMGPELLVKDVETNFALLKTMIKILVHRIFICYLCNLGSVHSRYFGFGNFQHGLGLELYKLK